MIWGTWKQEGSLFPSPFSPLERDSLPGYTLPTQGQPHWVGGGNGWCVWLGPGRTGSGAFLVTSWSPCGVSGICPVQGLGPELRACKPGTGVRVRDLSAEATGGFPVPRRMWQSALRQPA